MNLSRIKSKLDNIFRKQLKLKFIFLFTLVFTFQLQASSFSQNLKVTLNYEDTLISIIMEDIESKTDFKFFLIRNEVNINVKTNININNKSLNFALSKLFEKTNIKYEIFKKQIVLKKKIFKPLTKINVASTNNFNINKLLVKNTVNLKLLNQTITGTITDMAGASIPGVSILEKGTTNATISDAEGKFILEVADLNATLQISHIGYNAMEVPLNGENKIKIVLKENITDLEEVVVVGYGTQKKVNLTGSVSTINLKGSQNRPITNTSQALAGLASGVSISQTSGRPGADGATIRIRGVGTLGNNNPLVIVDGVVGSLTTLNIQDVESISVLKDAASAAIYGSRAANGVIVVKTKTGEAGSKFKVNYNVFYGFQKATKLTQYITNSADYMEGINLAMTNTNSSVTPKFTTELIKDFRDNPNNDLYPNTDWNDVMYRNALITNHHLSFVGGTKNVRYAFSLGYTYQEGIFLGTRNEPYNSRINIDVDITKKLSVSLKLSGRHNSIDEPPDGASNIITWAENNAPHYPTIKDGRLITSAWDPWNAHGNVYGSAVYGMNNTADDNWVINLSGQYEIVEGLKLKGTVSMDTNDALQKIFWPSVNVYNSQTNEPLASKMYSNTEVLSVRNVFRRNRYITLSSLLTYKKTFDEHHNLYVFGGYNQDTYNYSEINAFKKHVPDNALPELRVATDDPAADGYSSSFALQSYFGRLNYNYKEKYLFEANARYDGTSNFAKEHRWGIFPSFSVGWNLHKEDFLKSVSIIDELKIRASWGKLGNQNIAANQYLSVLNFGYQYSFGGTNPSLVGGVASTSLSNPIISWETSTQTDIGVDLSLLKGKIDLTLDYYLKDTEGILRRTSLSKVVGSLSAPFINLASVQNKGIELKINYSDYIGGISYSIGGNLTTIENEVTKIEAPQLGFQRIVEGRSINEFYTVKMLGIFQNENDVATHTSVVDGVTTVIQPDSKPGDVKFEDKNKDGKINNDDRQPIGKSIPGFLYGINVSLGYKGIDFSMIWQGIGDVLARTEEESKPMVNSRALPKFWVDNGWTAENPNNEYPRLLQASLTSSGYQSWRQSSLWLEDGSFLRLKNIQLGYTIPSSILKRLKIENCRVYINASNPLTITKYRGKDPERGANTSRSAYSNVEVYTMGLTISI